MAKSTLSNWAARPKVQEARKKARKEMEAAKLREAIKSEEKKKNKRKTKEGEVSESNPIRLFFFFAFSFNPSHSLYVPSLLAMTMLG
jgi:hypothetical protein